ncbi:MAG: RluA family pseudouridine synthase [Planctomycetota bacterium]|nr:MAG: RluA family pseudouridine synthase [Planctomycetota bacterium]
MNKRKRTARRERKAPRDLSLPLEALRWRVEDPAEDGARLDRFLMERLTWRSRSSIVHLLREGKVSRNGEAVTRKAARVHLGDEVAVAVPPPAEEERHAELGERLAAAVLYQDEHLIALAKPAGLVVHPVGRVRVNTLIQALHWAFLHGPLRRAGRGPDRIPRICHRLDKDTSGVIVLALTLAARSRLQAAFDARDALEKDYFGVVVGAPEGDGGRVDLPLGRDEEAAVGLMMTSRPDGLPAATSWRVRARGEGLTALGFRIHTGRQHQIRVHAAQGLGCPILCDPLYGKGERCWPAEEPVLRRQALHAERLAFDHPIGGERVELRAPLPEDLRAVGERLVPG